jgi:hypothetical protein
MRLPVLHRVDKPCRRSLYFGLVSGFNKSLKLAQFRYGQRKPGSTHRARRKAASCITMAGGAHLVRSFDSSQRPAELTV